ncbi:MULTISPECIES: 50S ribosomal protein L29 [Sphaerochaeta]|jgi:large subunit ribosomal protein L29|uniref:Large ribosomal subunit protein uL29 n=2 Tax=root TaxID=1 RepID=A0ABY4D9G1_9SPIR|nr:MULTISPECIES: 50S ribosomal protein L29 [Sphaerochaeta]MDT3358911.1 50S ribosomal protein L29 [Spirochaetota bacterium]NLA99266.1 50S ribosomal protein L29 [Spirochaetales bacterium]MDD2394829.1 50S ribosomal protein L29 [Sphaerochaeta sp.]MDD3423554.1 50S ribosomal protein L29 [Sphaerochaeta sp.]MDD3457375.1 50S ribosomal protein L29 [Sphaerochaeta sp.]
MKNSYNDLTLDELAAKKEKLHKEYFDLRMGRVLGHVENPLAVRTIRRNIARVNTRIREYELGIRKAAK